MIDAGLNYFILVSYQHRTIILFSFVIDDTKMRWCTLAGKQCSVGEPKVSVIGYFLSVGKIFGGVKNAWILFQVKEVSSAAL
jgi:hypothetical protein